MTADEIKTLRKKMDLTQSEFANKVGVHKITVSRWERGEVGPSGLALKVLGRMAKRTKLK